nr:hypothetical protein [uncultured Mucilaginibacter sp.]
MPKVITQKWGVVNYVITDFAVKVEYYQEWDNDGRNEYSFFSLQEIFLYYFIKQVKWYKIA